MNFYSRLTEYHSKSRPSFILFTGFAAFLGSMTLVVGLAFLREIL